MSTSRTGRARVVDARPRANRRRRTTTTRTISTRWLQFGASAIGIPAIPDDSVVRTRLIDELRQARDTPIFVVEGPAGFGKTTAVAQWVAQDGRPTGWVTIGDAGNDPAQFVTDLHTALQTAFRAAPRPGASSPATDAGSAPNGGLRALASALKHAPDPFVMVLDEVERLRHQQLSVLRTVARSIPNGSQLVLVTRSLQPLSIETMTAQRAVTRIGIEQLAMSGEEAAELLRGAGVVLEPAAHELLVHRTEGWPAVVRLAADSSCGQANSIDGVASFGGSDHLLTDYLETEILSALSPATTELLLSTSVLERLSGPTCDELLGRDNSAALLADAARRMGRLLARTGVGTYRLHTLVREALHERLCRTDPAGARRLHAAASLACERRGDFDGAIKHAHRAGDRTRVTGLIWHAAPIHVTTVSTRKFAEWMQLWSDDEVAADPVLGICASWCALTRGDVAAASMWLALARRGPEDLVLPDGTPLASALALLRAFIGRRGPRGMLADADMAVDLGRADDPALVIASYLRATASRLLGHTDVSREYLRAAAAESAIPALRAHSLMQLAVLALDDEADHEARQIVETVRLEMDGLRSPERAGPLGVYPGLALFDSRFDPKRAVAETLGDAFAFVQQAVDAPPWLAIDARLLLARACLNVDDVRRSRALVRETELLLADYPDAQWLTARLDAVRTAIDNQPLSHGTVTTGLTPAEQRVMRYLPTHLTFPEIADELFVSRHTVKTQAVAVYRKLGVTSRSAAVAVAREMGVIDDAQGAGSA